MLVDEGDDREAVELRIVTFSWQLTLNDKCVVSGLNFATD
jgi:hypothetical protein